MEYRWKRIFAPLTLHKIRKHLEHETAVGSYPIYIKDNIDYCKWICIDIDSHKRVSKKQEETFPLLTRGCRSRNIRKRSTKTENQNKKIFVI